MMKINPNNRRVKRCSTCGVRLLKSGATQNWGASMQQARKLKCNLCLTLERRALRTERALAQ